MMDLTNCRMRRNHQTRPAQDVVDHKKHLGRHN